MLNTKIVSSVILKASTQATLMQKVNVRESGYLYSNIILTMSASGIKIICMELLSRCYLKVKVIGAGIKMTIMKAM